jgi:hypothetical protein
VAAIQPFEDSFAFVIQAITVHEWIIHHFQCQRTNGPVRKLGLKILVVVFIIGVAVAVIRMIVFHGRGGHGDDGGVMLE